MRASYQNATSIYCSGRDFTIEPLLITRTNSSSAVSVAGPAPTDEITLHALLLSSTGGSVWGQAEIATGYPLGSLQNTLAATNNAPPRHSNGQVFTAFVSIIAVKYVPVNSVRSWR